MSHDVRVEDISRRPDEVLSPVSPDELTADSDHIFFSFVIVGFRTFGSP